MGADTRPSKSAVPPGTHKRAVSPGTPGTKVLCPREREALEAKEQRNKGTKEQAIGKPPIPLSLFVNTLSKSAGQGETLHSFAVFC